MAIAAYYDGEHKPLSIGFLLSLGLHVAIVLLLLLELSSPKLDTAPQSAMVIDIVGEGDFQETPHAKSNTAARSGKPAAVKPVQPKEEIKEESPTPPPPPNAVIPPTSVPTPPPPMRAVEPEPRPTPPPPVVKTETPPPPVPRAVTPPPIPAVVPPKPPVEKPIEREAPPHETGELPPPPPPISKPEVKPEPKVEPKVEKVQPKPDPKVDPKPEVKPEPKVEKVEPKPEVKPVVPTPPKVEPKQEPKPEAKTEPKEVKPEKKVEKPTEAKPEKQVNSLEKVIEGLPADKQTPAPAVKTTKPSNAQPLEKLIEGLDDGSPQAKTPSTSKNTKSLNDILDGMPTEKPAGKKASSAKSLEDIMAQNGQTAAPAGSSAKVTGQSSSTAKRLGGGLNGSELEGIKRKIQNNWNVSPDANYSQSISIAFELDESGQVIGGSKGIRFVSGSREAFRAAQAAVMASQPFSELPQAKFEDWHEMQLNFDLRDLR